MDPQPDYVPPYTIGGQAVLEGVMMRSPTAVATAVRRADGEIVVTHRPFRGITSRYPILNVPIVRGGINLIETLYLGMQSLNYSAEQAMTEEERKQASKKTPVWAKITTGATLVLALGLGFGLFFWLPLVLTERIVAPPAEGSGMRGGITFNVVDGIFRMVFFLAYIWGISLWKEMRRVFQYHGAEHKSIFVFEAGLPLEPEYSKRFTTLHPRCGTSFLLLVMLTSIVVFTFFGRPETLGERFLRLACVPLIGGIAYELIKLSAKKSCERWMRPIVLPGLWLQKITTKEPTLEQVEVAMTAIRSCLAYEGRREEATAPALSLQTAGA